MEVKYTDMVTEYPEIIKELTAKAESDKLRHFNLSSFMSDRSLEYVFEKIDKDMKFFSVYIFMERLEDDLWEDERYTEKEDVHLCSLDTFSPMTACPPSASPQANAGRAQARRAGRNRFVFHREEKSLWLIFLIWWVIFG
jgi:hypothetical protein